jgi:Skp family chaperone for outer membrane proteins
VVVLRHGVVNMQRLLEAHPEREKLRQIERSLAAADAGGGESQASMDTARREFETAMEVRQNQDKVSLEKKEAQLREELGEQRRLFIEALAAEYQSILFNLDLKLKTVQFSTTESQSLKKERERVEAERQQKLVAKDEALVARFQQEMSKFADELSVQTKDYANKWMDDRLQRLKTDSVKPEQEKRRQEFVELSGKMMQDVRQAVSKVALQEKLDIVWTRVIARQQAIDITDAVVLELTK